MPNELTEEEREIVVDFFQDLKKEFYNKYDIDIPVAESQYTVREVMQRTLDAVRRILIDVRDFLPRHMKEHSDEEKRKTVFRICSQDENAMEEVMVIVAQIVLNDLAKNFKIENDEVTTSLG